MALKPYFTEADYADPFPPAWIYGNQPAMDAATAWNQLHMKRPPGPDDFSSPPQTKEDAARNAIAAAIIQGRTQGTDVLPPYLPGGNQGGRDIGTVTDITDTAPPVTDITDTGKPVTDITDTPAPQKAEPQAPEAPAPPQGPVSVTFGKGFSPSSQEDQDNTATALSNPSLAFSGFSTPSNVSTITGPQFGTIAEAVAADSPSSTTSAHGSQTAAENALGHTTTGSPADQGWGTNNPAPIAHGVPLNIQDSPLRGYEPMVPDVPAAPKAVPNQPDVDPLGQPLGTPNIGPPQGKSLAQALAEKGEVQSPIGAPVTHAQQQDMDKATIAQLAALQQQAEVDQAISAIAEQGVEDMGPAPNVQQSVQEAAQQSQTTAPQSHAMSQTAAENEMGLTGQPGQTAASLAAQAAAQLGTTSPHGSQTAAENALGLTSPAAISEAHGQFGTVAPGVTGPVGPLGAAHAETSNPHGSQTAVENALGYTTTAPTTLGPQSAIQGLVAPVMAQEEDPDAPQQGPTTANVAHGFMNDMDKADLAQSLAQSLAALAQTQQSMQAMVDNAVQAAQKGDPLGQLAQGYTEANQAPMSPMQGINTAVAPSAAEQAQAATDAAVAAALGSGTVGPVGGYGSPGLGDAGIGGFGEGATGISGVSSGALGGDSVSGVTGQGFGDPGGGGYGVGSIGAPGQGFSDGFGQGATGVAGAVGDGSVAGSSGMGPGFGGLGGLGAAAAAAAAEGAIGDGIGSGTGGGVSPGGGNEGAAAAGVGDW